MASVMRTPLVAGNWKMYRGGAAGCELAGNLAQMLSHLADVDVVVAPPFTALAAVAHEVQGSRISVAAQNMYFATEGAFTGEVSAPMLLEAGCSWVILGHSERRQLFAETDELVSKKVDAALTAGIRPIVCVGETLEEREAGKTLDVVFRQVDAFAQKLAGKPGYAAIAYEPVWAIGTGRVAGPEQAQEVHAAVRGRLAAVSAVLAEQTRVLYGGSVKPDNARGLFGCADIDGALVGGASLEADSFARIAQAASRI
ncbi:MAG TPA: triose-phosphate isomerase [Polyangiaceae bacterium]|nr:triose-phosphate isomerase [Polyangiaceae bacterium]